MYLIQLFIYLYQPLCLLFQNTIFQTVHFRTSTHIIQVLHTNSCKEVRQRIIK